MLRSEEKRSRTRKIGRMKSLGKMLGQWITRRALSSVTNERNGHVATGDGKQEGQMPMGDTGRGMFPVWASKDMAWHRGRSMAHPTHRIAGALAVHHNDQAP